jgi:hypothetical protein
MEFRFDRSVFVQYPLDPTPLLSHMQERGRGEGVYMGFGIDAGATGASQEHIHKPLSLAVLLALALGSGLQYLEHASNEHEKLHTPVLGSHVGGVDEGHCLSVQYVGPGTAIALPKANRLPAKMMDNSSFFIVIPLFVFS